MNQVKKTNILSIYMGKFGNPRGTPIRIENILANLVKYNDLAISIASLDTNGKKTITEAEHLLLFRPYGLNIIKNNIKLFRYVQAKNIDIIIGHTMVTWVYLLPLKILTRKKIVLETHGFAEEEKLLYKKINLVNYYIKKIIYKFFYKICDLIITCNETATEIILKYNRNVATVHGGVNLSIFNPEVRSKNYFKKEGVIIGYAGNSRIWQGVDFMIRNFKELNERYPDFKLKILASEPLNIVENSQIQVFNKVNQEEVPHFLIDCDILVIPRPHNKVNDISFPSKLPEYMAMGKAIVASKTSDMHKIIKDEFNGLLYEPDDSAAFKNCLLKLRNEEYRANIGHNAYITAKENLNWKKQVDIIHNNLIKLMT